jgi:transposase
MENRKPYPTDLTPQQWAILQPILTQALQTCAPTRRGAPLKYSLYDILCAIFYILVNGLRWRDLPHDLPPWQTVYYHFRRWQRLGVWTQVIDTLSAHARTQAGRGAPKHFAVDSQSVPTTQKGGRADTMGARKSKGASGISSWTRRGRL